MQLLQTHWIQKRSIVQCRGLLECAASSFVLCYSSTQRTQGLVDLGATSNPPALPPAVSARPCRWCPAQGLSQAAAPALALLTSVRILHNNLSTPVQAQPPQGAWRASLKCWKRLWQVSSEKHFMSTRVVSLLHTSYPERLCPWLPDYGAI